MNNVSVNFSIEELKFIEFKLYESLVNKLVNYGLTDKKRLLVESALKKTRDAIEKLK